MNWLNIELTTLRKPQFIGSEPESRGVWLCVLSYCVSVENGGLIEGGSTWKDRQWQQTCGVTLKEIRKAKKLFSMSGDDICVWGYPVEKQKEVIQKRETAKINGQKGGRPVTNGKPTLVTNGNQHPKAEGEGKEKGSIIRAEAQGDHQKFIGMWCEEYPKYHNGEKYAFQSGKDAKTVQSLLATTAKTPDQLIAMAIAAWKSPFGFHCGNAGSITGFNSRFNDIRTELNKAISEKPKPPVRLSL